MTLEVPSPKDVVIINLPGADVTLISSDGARFNVLKSVLSIASPFFLGMFELPQTSSASPDQLPEVPMVTENAHVLEAILRYTLPIAPRHTLASISEAVHLLDTARKFQLEGTELAILNDVALLLSREPNPLKAWSYAIRCGSELARQTAMIQYLKVEESDLVAVTEEAIEELEWATARAYYELVKWRQDAIESARKAIKEQDRLEECVAGRLVSATSFKKTFRVTIARINPYSCYETNFLILAKACATAAQLSSCNCDVCQGGPPLAKQHLTLMGTSVKSKLEEAQSMSYCCFAYHSRCVNSLLL